MPTVSTTSVLRAEGLRKSYGRGEAAVQAVASVDIAIDAGEMVAIMGSSGSGKTTLLHLMAGLIRPDSGALHLGDDDLTALTDAQVTAVRSERIGVVFQAYNLMPTLTALDNVALPLLLCGVSRAAAHSISLERLEQVGMEQRAERRPAQLSGGEQQRVAVARALANSPSVLLADEPTGNLDHTNARAVCQLLRDIASDEDRSTAIVTHDPLVADYADRIIILADGRVADSFQREAVGTTEDLAVRCLRVANGGA